MKSLALASTVFSLALDFALSSARGLDIFRNLTLRLFPQNASCFQKNGPNNDKRR